MNKRTPKPTADLDQYYISYLCGVPQLVGIVKNHYARPDLVDGETIRTSRVLRIDFTTMRATTLNTIYNLGKPCTDQK